MTYLEEMSVSSLLIKNSSDIISKKDSMVVFISAEVNFNQSQLIELFHEKTEVKQQPAMGVRDGNGNHEWELGMEMGIMSGNQR